MVPRSVSPDEAAAFKPYHRWGGLGARTLRLRQVMPDLNLTGGQDSSWIMDLRHNLSRPATGARLARGPPVGHPNEHFAPTEQHLPFMTFTLPLEGQAFANDTRSDDIDPGTGWAKHVINATLASGATHSFTGRDFATGRIYEVSRWDYAGRGREA